MDDDLAVIREDMLEIGRKYAQLAKSAESVKRARLAFSIAKEAYNMVMQMQPAASDNMYILFFMKIDQRIPRPILWADYLKFCQCHNTKPLKKSALFNRLKLMNFQLKKSGGQVIVRPPEDRQALIRAARYFERPQIIDASFSVEGEEVDDQSA